VLSTQYRIHAGSTVAPVLRGSIRRASESTAHLAGDAVDVVLVLALVEDRLAVDVHSEDAVIAGDERHPVEFGTEVREQRVLDVFGAFEEATGDAVFDLDCRHGEDCISADLRLSPAQSRMASMTMANSSAPR